MDFASGLWLSCNKSRLAAQRLHLQRCLISTKVNDLPPEDSIDFTPKFDSQGLVSAVVQHETTGEVLMVAFMDAQALAKTRETGFAHFHSRSRGRLWKKGESSGNVLRVRHILVDCDQDALVLVAQPEGPTCHTGARSCFYRKLEGETLLPVDEPG